MVLGFLVCTILQFTVLSYYFEEEMNTLQMDEFGVSNLHSIQSKIKSKLLSENSTLFNSNEKYGKSTIDANSTKTIASSLRPMTASIKKL